MDGILIETVDMVTGAETSGIAFVPESDAELAALFVKFGINSDLEEIELLLSGSYNCAWRALVE